jgi:hypothetical protein
MTRPRRNVLLLAVVVVATLLWFAVAWPSFRRVNTAAHAAMCGNNLKVLEQAKAKWAQQEHKTANDTPAWSDLVGTNGYLKERFSCPDGGVITIGAAGERPKCSVPGHDL